MFTKIELRRNRDFSNKINSTFEFARQNLKPLFKAVLYISGPLLLLQGLCSGFYQNESLGRIRAGEFGGFNISFLLWLSYLMMILSYTSIMVVVYEYLRIYESRKNAVTIEVNEVWQGVKKNYFPVFGATLILALLTALGIVLLIIPGIYLLIVFTIVPPIMVIEGAPFSDAFSRSFKLISDKWWSTLGLIIIMFLIVFFMTLILYIPLMAYVAVLSLHIREVSENPELRDASLIILSSIYSFGAGIFQSLVYVAIGFQVYNLVERREAKGLMIRLEEFGKSAEQTHSANADETY